MMITAKTTEFDKVSGLDLGADDYITKPFGMAELVARVKALLRRSGMKTSAERPQHDELTVDIAKHTVSVGGQNVILTYKEFSLLACLMENAGRARSRASSCSKLFGAMITRAVRGRLMCMCRPCAQSSAKAGASIETVRGVGYRFGE